MTPAAKMVDLARRHIGKAYLLGVLVPKNDPNWLGEFDCAEFASHLVYQVSGRLVGCRDNDGDPATADAYTGYWDRDARLLNAVVPIEVAAATAGAFMLRVPVSGQTGHIVLCDGQGGTIEAMGSRYGVCAGKLDGRRWSFGVRLPFLAHGSPSASRPLLPPATAILRLGSHGDAVLALQRALAGRGLYSGALDGSFDARTAEAVRQFQLREGLVPDAEVGPLTLDELGIES